MAYWLGLLADAAVVAHMGFVLFVVLGGLAVYWRPWVLWLHVPAVLWGVSIEWVGAVCPLTLVENWLRNQAGEAGYAGDFIQQYLLPTLYPAGLTREIQIVLGAAALGINIGVYFSLWRRRRCGSIGP
ncbi:MAG: hypothetical protein CL486_10265 [Acidobacteria bacterium]|jgi:hypothetical protein|nr:hypothetical protein [Acidobacteriota bacterium]|tara:strand:+ start:1661 stop:2044 length:384 start_codon:yes stop_codon:yes gene_type:complete